MINLFRKTELEYVRCFSKELIKDKFRRFYDKNLEDIYANNITIINSDTSKRDIANIIINEIKERRKNRKDFLIVEIQDEINKRDLVSIKFKYSRIDSLYFMCIITNNYGRLPFNDECKVERLMSEKSFEDAMKINILDYSPSLGVELATLKTARKIQVYRDKTNNLTAFICYYKGKAIGFCEVFIDKNIAKIEEFLILKGYRGIGFGTSLLREVIKYAKENNADIAYVITESNNTVKQMYSKCGFETVGKKQQIIYDFY